MTATIQMTPIEKIQEAERLLIEARDDSASTISVYTIAADVLDILRIGCHSRQLLTEDDAAMIYRATGVHPKQNNTEGG